MASPRLLVVDEDPASLSFMTEVFGSLHTNVCPINDNQQAAVKIEQQQFDGIFLDIDSSTLDILELAHLARQSSCNKLTPIVVVTGREQDEIMYQSFCKGATFFLAMPIDRADLLELVETIQSTFRADRRRYSRVLLQTPVTCCVGSRTLTGSSCNLSQGGMQVEVEQLNAGEILQLSFRLSQPPVSIEASGVVAWAKDGRQGVHFTRMSVEHQQLVRDFIALPESSPR
jgi:CheY-like chemotaxis protein